MMPSQQIALEIVNEISRHQGNFPVGVEKKLFDEIMNRPETKVEESKWTEGVKLHLVDSIFYKGWLYLTPMLKE